jgi:hypothetical protein
VKHGPNATLGPYGPYRDWPPKTGADADNQGVPELLAVKRVTPKVAPWIL